MNRTLALAAGVLFAASLTGCATIQEELAPIAPAAAPAPAPTPAPTLTTPPATVAPTTTAPAPKPTGLYWIGDSVSYFTGQLLNDALPADAIVNADPGRGLIHPGAVTGENMTWVAGQRAIPMLRPGGWLVIQGSVNDGAPADGGGDLPTVAVAMQSIVNALPDDRCLAYQPPYRGDMPFYQGEWADTLTPIVEQQPCHMIINGWLEANTADPTLTYDTVHPTEAGKSTFADVARQAFD